MTNTLEVADELVNEPRKINRGLRNGIGLSKFIGQAVAIRRADGHEAVEVRGINVLAPVAENDGMLRDKVGQEITHHLRLGAACLTSITHSVKERPKALRLQHTAHVRVVAVGTQRQGTA